MADQGSSRLHDARLSGLELVRFFSALSILVWHYQQFLFVGRTSVGLVPGQQPFYGVLFPFYEAGHLGVQAFWCISGFVFFYKYRQIIESRRISPERLFWLRFSRLYPLHIATLLIVATLQLYRGENGLPTFVYADPNVTDFIGHLLMANGWFYFERFSFNGPVWSVSTEILTYAAFFAAAYFSRLTLGRTLAVASLGFVAMAAGSRHPLIACVFLFFMGGAAELVCRERLSRRGVQIAAVLLLAAVAVRLGVGEHVKLHKPLTYLALGLATCLILIVLHRYEAAFRSLGRAPEVLGSLTYASYLIHFPLELALATWASKTGWSIPFYDKTFFLAWMASVLTLSWLVFRYFEAPAQAKLREALADVPVRSRPEISAPRPSPAMLPHART